MKTKITSLIALLSFLAMLSLGLFSCKKDEQPQPIYNYNVVTEGPTAIWRVQPIGDTLYQPFRYVFLDGEGYAETISGIFDGRILWFKVPVGQTYTLKYLKVGWPNPDGEISFTPTNADVGQIKNDTIPCYLY